VSLPVPELLGGLSPVTLLLAVCVMAGGAALQAAVGMGLGLFVFPLLALLDPRFVPGPMQVGAAFLALGMVRRERTSVQWSGLTVAVTGLLVGTAVGVWALTLVDSQLLTRVFGVLILLAVALSVSGMRVAPSRPSMLAGGVVAGVMGAMAGIHGPPLALVLQDASPSRLRAMLAAFFVVGYAAAILALAAVGLFGLDELLLGALLVPGAMLGYRVGPLLGRRLDGGRLRIAVLVTSAASAVALLLR
jgi:hypothetical protein